MNHKYTKMHENGHAKLFELMLQAMQEIAVLVEMTNKGDLLHPLKSVQVAQSLMAYSSLHAALFHQYLGDKGLDKNKNKQQVEDYMYGSMAAMYTTFVGTFNQTATRDDIIAAKDRADILFQHHCDEYVAQVINNLDK